MVPNGWKITSLREVCSGNLQTGPFGSQLHAHEYVPSGIPVLMPKDLNDCRADLVSAAKITQEKADSLGKHVLKDGDLLFSRRGDVSRFALIDSDSEGALCGTGCLKARPNSQHSSKFLAYFIQKESVKKWLEQNAVGQTMPNMNTEILGELPLIAASSKEEEEKIAQILSTWDKAITTTEQLLANSQQQKKALMQQLLTGKKRLLDKNGVRFSGEWVWLKASELFKTVSKKNNAESEDLLAVTQDQGVLPRALLERRVVMPEGTTQSYKLVVPGNFIISLRSFQGGLEYSTYRGLVSPAYTVLAPIKSIDDGFYKQYYKSYDFIGHLAVAVIGIRDGKQISYEDFSFLKLPYPSIEEQQKIAAVLSIADQEISALQQKLDVLKQEKKALMQQLLTGKRRVIN
ncbi:restriction endonuclease subunit S [Shewanella algae]|jgi:type I restriction enzyme S subunit|uniref:restriction endonuclease subunit S n=1 Tax=Shewanella algae TaxID=38313 RepID=UPI0031F561CA